MAHDAFACMDGGILPSLDLPAKQSKGCVVSPETLSNQSHFNGLCRAVTGLLQLFARTRLEINPDRPSGIRMATKFAKA